MSTREENPLQKALKLMDDAFAERRANDTKSSAPASPDRAPAPEVEAPPIMEVPDTKPAAVPVHSIEDWQVREAAALERKIGVSKDD